MSFLYCNDVMAYSLISDTVQYIGRKSVIYIPASLQTSSLFDLSGYNFSVCISTSFPS